MACYVAPCVTTELMSVLMGNGDGTFQPARLVQVGRGMARIAVGDFNRDGIKDLAIAGDSSRLYRLYGVGDGTFVQQPTITLTADTFGVAGSDVDVADFNGDAIQDLVVVIGTNGSRTAVLIGNADGSFRPPLILTDANLSIPTQAAVADYNGDGFQDLAVGVGDGSFGLMKMYNGNGNGTFQAPRAMLIPPDKSSIGTVGLITAALNADAKPDLVLGIGGAFPGLAVLLNVTSQQPPPTPSAPSLLSPGQDATPDPDRRRERLREPGDRPAGHAVAVHDALLPEHPAALVARARDQRDRHAWTVVLDPALHAAVQLATAAPAGGPVRALREPR